MTRYSILIVEDEYIPAKYIKKILAHHGHNVVGIADSMESALVYLNKQHIDLVLMDIKINGNKDGIEIAQAFETYKKMAILYTTAYTDKKFLDRAKETNTIGYLVKPIQPNTLLSTIEISMSKFMDTFPSSDTIKICSTITLNIKRNILTFNDKEILLSSYESAILNLLKDEKDISISYKDLEYLLYENDSHTNTALRTIIWRLRKKVPDCFEIDNIYRYGYRLKCR